MNKTSPIITGTCVRIEAHIPYKEDTRNRNGQTGLTGVSLTY